MKNGIKARQKSFLNFTTVAGTTACELISGRSQRGYCDRFLPPRARRVLSDLVDRVHRGAIYVLALTILTVVNGNVFD